MDLLQVLVLALIQGVTEFLPISSSAHLILASRVAGWPDQGLAFDTAVHLGSLLAVLAYFRRELATFADGLVHLRHDAATQLLSKVVVATLPVAAAGLLFKPWIESEARTVGVIAATTIGFAVALWWADRHSGRNRSAPGRDEHSVTFAQAALIGVAQAVALIPGTSRAGITITAALLLGLSREGSARFSFLLAIPTIAGAALLSAIDATATGEALPWQDLATGFTVSAISAYACIATFVALLNRTGMMPYVLYRIALGLVLVAFACR